MLEYTIIPRHAGSFEVPALEFCYFEVKSGQYKTLSTESFQIEVERGIGDNSDNSNSVSNYTGTNQERLKVLGNDIRYIHKLDASDLSKEQPHFYGSFIYWLFYIVPIIIFIVLALVYRQQLKINANSDLRRTKKAYLY